MKRLIIFLFLMPFILSFLQCSKDEENPVQPSTQTVYITNVETQNVYIDYTSFGDLIGVWRDSTVTNLNLFIITSNTYANITPLYSYTNAGKIVEKDEEQSYFIIQITNNSLDSSQIGNYTKVHWRNYKSFSVNKAQVELAEHYPQASTLNEARQQSVSDVSFWSVLTNY